MKVKQIAAAFTAMAMTMTALSAVSWNVSSVEGIRASEGDSTVDEHICSAKFEEYSVDWNQSGNCVCLALTNESSSAALNDWSLVYNCDAEILSIDGAEVINGKDVHHLKCCENDRSMEPGETCIISMTMDTEETIQEPEEYAVYFQYHSEEEMYEECTDFITVDLATGEMDAQQSDKSVSMVTDQTLEQNKSVGYHPNALCDDPVCEGMDKINYEDNRQWVTNPTVSPYSQIAALDITWSSGVETVATGFMISNHYLATSAHVVYDETYGVPYTITAYFGRNGSSYAYRYSVSSYQYCINYPDNPACGNDWAVCYFPSNVGNTVGWFSIGYTTDSALSELAISVTGYPLDKMVKNTSAVDGYNKYMYTASSKVSAVYDYSFRYTADTYGGQSGSPVYRGVEGTVHGIHHGGVNGEQLNQAKRITQAIFNTWKNNGWIS